MDVCSKVFQCPPIMEIIFKFLSVKDLNSCAKVCILWRSMSLTEKNKRRFVEWFLEVFEEQGNPVTRSFQKMKAPMKRKTTKKKVEIGESVDMDGNRIAAAPQAGKLYPFQEKLAAVRAQPNFCLAFVTADTLKHIDKVFSCLESTVAPMKKLPKQHSNTYDMKVMDDEIIRSGLKAIVDRFFNPLLPVQCELHCIASPGIIGCQDNLSTVEVEKGYAISGLLLPDFPGVTVHHCPVEKIWNPRDFHLTFPNVPIKCMLMFASSLPLHWHGFPVRCPAPSPKFRHTTSCSLPPPAISQDFIDNCIVYNDRKFAVGGMHVEPLSHSHGSCVAFAGENLEAASIVIVDGTADVAYELALFKKTGLLENQCFALMFSDVDGGIRKYSVPNYESSIFRSLYPDVPLAGVVGNRAIGRQFLPNVDIEDPDHKQRMFPSKCCQNSGTVFVLLSVKTLK